MRSRVMVVALAAGALALGSGGGAVAQERPRAAICTSGGTPAATTGTFAITPGLSSAMELFGS